MAGFRITKLVEAPPAHVFEVFSDLEKAADRITGILEVELLTQGPIGKGTRFRETRIVFKREATEELEITAFEPGRSYTVEAESCGARFTTVFTFSPEGEHTRVDLDFHSRAVSLFARIMSPLGWLMRGAMRRAMEKDLDELKAAAEG